MLSENIQTPTNIAAIIMKELFFDNILYLLYIHKYITNFNT